jgi:hypothetical protein
MRGEEANRMNVGRMFTIPAAQSSLIELALNNVELHCRSKSTLVCCHEVSSNDNPITTIVPGGEVLNKCFDGKRALIVVYVLLTFGNAPIRQYVGN